MSRSCILSALFSLVIAGPLFAQQQTRMVFGQWKPVKGVMEGKKVPDSTLASMELTINHGTYRATSGGKENVGRMIYDEAASPSQIVFTISGPGQEGTEIKAICRFQENQLQIAFSQTADFPSGFSHDSENRHLLMTYESLSGGVVATGPGKRQPPKIRAASGGGFGN